MVLLLFAAPGCFFRAATPTIAAMSDIASQRWNARQYADNARFVTDLGMPVVELLAPRPGERILDLGCGDGAAHREARGPRLRRRRRRRQRRA